MGFLNNLDLINPEYSPKKEKFIKVDTCLELKLVQQLECHLPQTVPPQDRPPLALPSLGPTSCVRFFPAIVLVVHELLHLPSLLLGQ